MCRIQDMCPPVTQRTHTEVIPATPLSHMVIMVIIMMLHYTQPGIPVHCLRNRLTHRHMFDIRIPSVPAAGRVHMRCYGCYIFYKSGFFPGFELVIIRFRMSLVTHLSDYSVFLFAPHHQFHFIEGTSHRFFHIDMFTMSHRFNCNREMRVIGSSYRNCIDLVRHLIKHLAKILKTLGFREHRYKFLRMLGPHIHITKSHYIT